MGRQSVQNTKYKHCELTNVEEDEQELLFGQPVLVLGLVQHVVERPPLTVLHDKHDALGLQLWKAGQDTQSVRQTDRQAEYSMTSTMRLDCNCGRQDKTLSQSDRQTDRQSTP